MTNGARNRFTSVDTDASMCPAPALAVPHAYDTLFPAGPCALGRAVNGARGERVDAEFRAGEYVAAGRGGRCCCGRTSGT